jgi:hypothetical protein
MCLSALGIVTVLIVSAAPSSVRALELGAHVGVGLDAGSIHLGGDLLIPIAELSPSVRLHIWPSAAFVIIQEGRDGILLGADFPFEFAIANTIVAPFVGPGLGVSIFDDARLKLNVIGGIFIDAGPVRPFAEIALRFIDGTYVDLLVGVLVEL